MYFKKGLIERIVGEYATIRTEDGQMLKWETSNLSSSLHEGSEVILEIKDKQSAEKKQQELAAEILHEIFNHAKDTDLEHPRL